MALVREQFNWNGMDIVRHYSDSNFYIRQLPNDVLYGVADDPLEYESSRIYEETDIPIEQSEEEELIPEK